MRRRGFTLIEMLVVITSLSVMLGAAVCLLCALMKAEGVGRQRQQRSESLSLFAERFRRDAHAAVEAPETRESSPGVCVWVFPLAAGADSRYVEYETRDGFVTRREHGPTGPDRWETFAVPKDSAVTVETASRGGARLARLLIEAPEAALLGRRRVCVEAVLGRDHRFARPAEGGE
ncbi:MAG: prepilin-type N-terminal cleavage/methylation domain-containing protein [Pirellulales bacterium]|nr:prepilin-type N-terminal cleavage/methylation domain-containing protein [Pirellulales bacterium]